jgi:hypothetical protein
MTGYLLAGQIHSFKSCLLHVRYTALRITMGFPENAGVWEPHIVSSHVEPSATHPTLRAAAQRLPEEAA